LPVLQLLGLFPPNLPSKTTRVVPWKPTLNLMHPSQPLRRHLSRLLQRPLPLQPQTPMKNLATNAPPPPLPPASSSPWVPTCAREAHNANSAMEARSSSSSSSSSSRCRFLSPQRRLCPLQLSQPTLSPRGFLATANPILLPPKPKLKMVRSA
jgi:hypothetical protein